MKKQSEVTNFSPSHWVLAHRFLGGSRGFCLVLSQPSKANSFLSLECGATQMLRGDEQPLPLLTRGLGVMVGQVGVPSVSGVGMAVPDEMRFLCRRDCSWETRPIGGKVDHPEVKWRLKTRNKIMQVHPHPTESQWSRASALAQLPTCFWYWKRRVEHGVENSTIQSPHDTISLWPLLQ